jgi:hypothetical protein
MLLVAVPGHHVFNHLQAFQNRVSFRFILKLLVRGMHLRDELVWRRLLGYPDHRSGEKRIHSSYPDCFWLKVTGMRAAIYARISTHDGWQDAQRQLPQLGPLAATQGWEIRGDYIHHESGGHFDRVEFRLVGPSRVEQPLPASEKLGLAHQVAEALGHGHEPGVIRHS